MKKPLLVASLIAVLASVPAPVFAQAAAARSQPAAPPLPAPIPAARDVPYPGTITLDIDASDTVRAVYRVTQVFPVPAGERTLTLLQPSWLPGNHAPSGPVALMADIRFFAGGKELAWSRDTVAVNAFHVTVPEGATSVTAKFVHTSPLERAEGRITMTQEMLNLQWEKMSLYPAGYYTRGITVKPTVTFPRDWQVYTALDGMSRKGDAVTWAPIDYENLVDSPIFAGRYAQRFDLGQSVYLDTVADKPELLAIKPENLETYRNLVGEALATFGARHFDRYSFLLALTDRMGGIGLEHHRSSENQMEPKTWVDWEKMDWDRNVIPHEFAHSWNGKYRRPADLWTPDFQQPMQNTLLWVYEGQTQFWGLVHAARSGIQRKETVLGSLASYAGRFAEGTPGRGWRPVEDTTHAPQIAQRRPLPYVSITRTEDYYTEGALVWLEADQIIREGTKGARGLDDFARAFFGMRDGDWGQLTYTFDDVVSTLNGVYPHDWAGFLKTRFYAPAQPAPLKGIEKAGYRLVWKETPNPYDKAVADFRGTLDLTYSLGFALDKEGVVTSALWNGLAFNAGLVDGAKIVAVNGITYDADTMRGAITAAKGTKTPVELLVRRGDRYLTVPLDYHGGLRYPWLEKAENAGETGLDRLLTPRRARK